MLSDLVYSVDSNLEHLASVIETSRSVSGLGGASTIVPVQSEQEVFWYFNTRWFIDAFWHSLWLCDRVVRTRPMQMQNSWGKMTVKGGDRAQVDAANKWMRCLSSRYAQGQMLANAHGGSTMIRIVDDGRLSDEPIDINRIKNVRYSRIFDRWEIYPDPHSYYYNPAAPDYYLLAIDPQDNLVRELVEQEGTSPLISGEDLNRQNILYPANYAYWKIHSDRVVRFDGKYLPAETLKCNQGWHASTLVTFLSPCLRYLEALGYVGSAIKTFEFVLFLVDDMVKMLGSPKGRSQLREKGRLNNEMISSLQGIMADRKKEEVQIVSRNFSGASEIIDQLRKEMQGASELDAIELFQEHPTGLAQTGQSQRLEKALKIKENCAYHWGRLIEGDPLSGAIGDLDLYLLSDNSPFPSLPTDFSWEWNSSIVSTPEEVAKIYDLYSRGDRNYRDSGTLTPEEVRSRFDGDAFSDQIILDQNSFNQMQEEKQQIQQQLTPAPPPQNQDAVEKFIPPPGDRTVLPESEYEQILNEVEAEFRM